LATKSQGLAQFESEDIEMAYDEFLNHLPAVFREDEFLAHYLAAFEKILFGRDDLIEFEDEGLEETIARIAEFFDPAKTPEDFLEWLACWVALSLRADMTVVKQRLFIGKIVQLYKKRGTRANLQELLEIFLKGTPSVEEPDVHEMQIGEQSTIGEDTYLGGGPPHFFQVTISLARPSPEFLTRQLQTARALIDLEKPAHTYYKLTTRFPTIQIGCSSTIGINTIIGTEIKDMSRCAEEENHGTH
jgi:phage tail-like protein